MDGSPSDSAYWNDHYQRNDTGWDLGGPAPPFVNLLADPERTPTLGRIAVPCCGRGHDALLFARHGFQVVGIDFAHLALAEAWRDAERQGLPVEWVQADLFNLPASLSGSFDYVLEHTSLSAVEPHRWGEYVRVMRSLLKPAGQIIGLFYNHGQPGGPPFTTSEPQIRELYGPFFEVEQLEVARDSHERRQGLELFARLRLKA